MVAEIVEAILKRVAEPFIINEHVLHIGASAGVAMAPNDGNNVDELIANADLALYQAQQFPAPYRGGAFIAFHGSWNRAPAPQGGYNVVFQPLADGRPSGNYVVFADGFAGASKEPGRAAHRPPGLAVGPDGALYIADFYNCIIGHYEVPLDHPRRDRDHGRVPIRILRSPGSRR